MSEWSNVTLKDIADFNPRESVKKGEVAVKVGMDKLQPFCRDITEIEYAEFTGGTKFRNDDTIMARITPCLENGKTAMVNVLEKDQVGFGSTEYIVFRAKKGMTDPYFLYYLVCSPTVREPAIKSMVGSSGRQRVQIDVVQNLEIKVPSLTEQKKIGDFLRKLDDKIAINNKINRNLEDQANAIYKSWFIDFSINNYEKPILWREGTVEDITSLVSRGITPKYDENSKEVVINQKCIRNHIIDLTVARNHNPKVINEKWLNYGDLLLNSTGQGTLGRAAQVWFEPKNLTVDSHVTIVRPKSTEWIYYLGFWGINTEREIEALHTGSTGQTELPRDRVKLMPIILPDKDTLLRFNEIVKPITTKIVRNQCENIKLAHLRDSILPKLMSGKFDVSGIDI